MNKTVVIPLLPQYFSDKETIFASTENLTASTFRYSTGVAGLRIKNGIGEIEMLPFQGQQIWRSFFYGRELAMRTMFPEPIPGVDFLSTYGAFLIHCGAAGMGSPGPEDSHVAHGELPNAIYQSAQLIVGEDSLGPYMSVTGEYKYTVAFSQNYIARPKVTIREGSARLNVELELENLKSSPMEYMYLAHINFLPVDHGRVIDTVKPDKDHCYIIHTFEKLRESSADYRRMIEQYESDPELHRFFDPDQIIDPEIVLAIFPTADESGWASSMQLHPNGSADFVRYRLDEFDHSLRWIARSPDQEALGLTLPSTAEPDGYTAEKAKGNIRILDPKSTVRFEIECGALDPAETQVMMKEIESIK
jgi:hypothetical protein